MEIKEEIARMIADHKVMLFMKGSPDQPQCGFSARVVQILQALNAPFGYFDVLSDNTIREEVKKYSDWPTIPQLYINKEFIGGCDIVQEQYASGELEKKLASLTQIEC